MCFSAQASFGASIILGLLAYGTMKKIKRRDAKIMTLAYIPLFFAIQQLCEGFVWLEYGPLFMYLFLVFAFFIWPTYIPYAFYEIETNQDKQKILLIIQGVGLTVTSALAALLYLYGFSANISCHHIAYSINIALDNGIHTWGLICYATATLMPFFVSSKSYARNIGLIIAGSLFATLIMYHQYFTSVWCFFAALISGCVYWLI